MPSFSAWRMTKLVGRKAAKKNMKFAVTTREKRSSRSGSVKSVIFHGLGLGGRRDRTRKSAVIRRPR